MSRIAKAKTARRAPRAIIIGDDIRIPDWVVDFDSFRRWTHSAKFPRHGRIDYLAGEIWIELGLDSGLVPPDKASSSQVILGRSAGQRGNGNNLAGAKPRPANKAHALPVVIDEQVRIPGWVVDLESFDRWACSDEFPEHGWISYLGGEIWVDLSMEEFAHNKIKSEIVAVLHAMVKLLLLGHLFQDRFRLRGPRSGVSHEPDGMFVSFKTLESGRARLIEGSQQQFIQLEGIADMVLEVIAVARFARTP